MISTIAKNVGRSLVLLPAHAFKTTTHIARYSKMGGTFHVAARFQDSDICIIQKAIKMVLRCILSVVSHLSGFKL